MIDKTTTMSVDINEIARKISAVRKAKLPEIEKNLEKLEMMEQSVAEIQSRLISFEGEDHQKLEGIRFDKAIEEIRKAKRKNTLARIRLSRESLNIGIAGNAKQGKSQFLQMLTGLNDSQILTGDVGYCTASRSVVRNKEPQKATVFYMSANDFMSKKVYYAYEGSFESGINLSPRPRNLRDFIDSPLPARPDNLFQIDNYRYDLLEEIHKALNEFKELQQLIDSGEQEVDIKNLRCYLSKDEGGYHHYVVDHVEIQTPFDALPEDSVVYDVPGMNDLQPDIEETMIKSVTEEADIVFYLRKPYATGDGWGKRDFDIIGELQKVYSGEGIKVDDWVQCVLNLDMRPESNNQRQVEAMSVKPPQGFTPIICECCSREDVCSKVTEIMGRLVTKCERIDNVRITEAHEAFDDVKNFVKREIYDAVNNVIRKKIAAESGFNFDNLKIGKLFHDNDKETTMNVDLNEIAKRISAVRKAKLPEIEKNLEKLEMMEQSVMALQTRVILLEGKEHQKLEGIRFDKAIEEIRNAREKNKLARTRLSRESLNIGIAGQARQGKSQFLKMLTGLNDSQIPTGDVGYCTASRSVVRNKEPQKAIVHYMSEEDFMRKKVYYAYEGSSKSGINLSPRPRNLRDFIDSPLPARPANLVSLDNERYDLLEKLHKALNEFKELQQLIDSGEQEVDINNLRRYLTKDEGDIYHYVVDHVEIQTPFDALPEDSVVYDVPGMNDPQPDIEETMIKTVTEDADIVFYLRKPCNTGDGWGTPDFDIIGKLQKVYSEEGIKVDDWVQCVLNLDMRESNNQRQVEAMSVKPPQGFTPIICNCGSREDVCSKVIEIMERLVTKCERIDNVRISEAHKAFDDVKIIVKRDIYDAVNNVIGDLIAADSGFDFEVHFKYFLADLRSPFRKYSKLNLEEEISGILQKYFTMAKDKIRENYGKLEKDEPVPEHFFVSTTEELKRDFERIGSVGVLEEATRNHREAIMAELKEYLSNCCEEIRDCYYDQIMEKGFKENKVLQRIFTDIDGEQHSSRDKIRTALERLRASENCNIPNICGAFESITNLPISYEGNILPSYYETSAFDDLDPDEPSEEYKGFGQYLQDLKTDFDKKAANLYKWLKDKTEEILSCVVAQNSEKNCYKIIAHNISKVILANYKSFAYHLIWGEPVESEWRRFADANKSTLWGVELQDAIEKSANASELRTLLKELSKAI